MRGIVATAALLLAACSGGGGSGSSGSPPTATTFLTADDVQRVIRQAVGEAQARGAKAQIAVVDRVGNVLAIFEMTGAPRTVTIASGLPVTGGFEGVMNAVAAAAVSKAITAAYLSSNGNAFTTRTANQIVFAHFNANEAQQPSGPLYGVQFSQLICSDVIEERLNTRFGPRPSPLGLAGDPGGIPLYKNGVLVGGIGVEADALYGLDLDITDVDSSVEEAIAAAGSYQFEAPADIRADRITADGRTLRFIDSVSFASDPASAPPFALLPGELAGLIPYNLRTLSAGQAFGSAASGIRAVVPGDTGGRWILVDDAGNNRYPVRAGTVIGHTPVDHLSDVEVEAILSEALAIAQRARGQIRRPLGSAAQVSISVVDNRGIILGLVRTADAPVFGIDVAVQKARTAMFFSIGGVNAFDSLSSYPAAARTFLANPDALTGRMAWSARAVGNLHRPFFPDGIDGTPAGPLSTPIANWSPFNVGFQLDLVANQIVNGANADTSKGCVGRAPGAGKPVTQQFGIPNGIQIFPGSVPIYRGSVLLGAIGVSGDGVDQDDMIAFLGLANAGKRLGSGLGNAPVAMRADTLVPMGTRLRYVQCPQSPFNGSDEQNVCAGL